MLPIKAWRIYYADGSTFDSKQGSWADAPPFGVQCIVWYHVDPFKTVQMEANDESIYVWQGEGDDANIKIGLWMDEEGFYRIMNLARQSSEP